MGDLENCKRTAKDMGNSKDAVCLALSWKSHRLLRDHEGES